MTPEEIRKNREMTEDMAAVKEAVLELGLEDWIPLPEAVASVELRATHPDRATWLVLAEALEALLVDERIRLYRGRWDDDDPRELSEVEAVEVLHQKRWYSFHIDDPEEERVSFVNVENIRGSQA